MPRLIITNGGRRGLERCRTFLKDVNPAASERAGLIIAHQLALLESHPAMGRPLAGDDELRELIIGFGGTGYVALYRHEPTDDAVYILAFRHQREAGY